MNRFTPRVQRQARPGNFIVTSFVLVMGIVMVMAGLNFFLREQLRQATDIQKVSMCKLQALYLAEMAINQAMYEANKSPDGENPGSVMGLDAGEHKFVNFTNNVAMVRPVSGQPVRADRQASCDLTFSSQVPPAPAQATTVYMRSKGYLLYDGEGQWVELDFVARKLPGAGQPWVMDGYSVRARGAFR